jgi:O-antigen/teichoic acid export membrane protein
MLKRNIVANFVGQAWRGLIAVAFVPLYVHYLGIESYALIGIFTLLLGWLSVVDTGLRATLSREMARFVGGALDGTAIRDVLRTIEVIVLAFGFLSALAIWGAAGYLAKWVHPEHLSLQTVTFAFAVMGFVIMLAFSEGMYLGCLSGMQRQVTENAINVVFGTMRSVGAALIIVFISRTVAAFFVWQGLVSLISITVAATIVYRVLPAGQRPARPSWSVISSCWRFAVGVTVVSFVWFLSAQIDKIMLSRTLSLADFGYYTMAATVAGLIGMLARPVTAAFWPRLTQLVAQGDNAGVRASYHAAAQIVTVLSATTAALLAAFSYHLLLLWTRDPALSAEVAPLLRILALGVFVQSMAIVPTYLQLAYGWTSLSVLSGVAALCLMIPAMLWTIPRYGTLGAAWSWVVLMLVYTSMAVILMHRRILRGEGVRWCLADVLGPASAAAAVGFACVFVFPRGMGVLASGAALALCGAAVFTAALMSAGQLRRPALDHLMFVARRLRSKAPAQLSAVRRRGI